LFTNGSLIQKTKETFEQDKKCFPQYATDVALSNDGNKLFFLTENNLNNDIPYSDVQVWDVTSIACQEILFSIKGHPYSLEISPNGNFLVAGISEGISAYRGIIETDKGSTVIWDMANRNIKCQIAGAPSVFIPNTNNLLVFESYSDKANNWINRLTLWESQDCKFIQEIMTITPPYGYLSPLSITSDGKLLAIGQRDILIIDLSTQQVLEKIVDPSPTATNLEHLRDILSFSPDGKLLFVTTPGKTGESLISMYRLEYNK
jgi:hypothetical protein